MLAYAKKGESVTCENGHIICKVAKDIFIGLIPDNTELNKWRQRKPELGEIIPKCAKCGADFYVNNYNYYQSDNKKYHMGIHMHFKDGWR